MDADTYPNAEVVAFVNQNFVAVKINGDKQPELTKKYKVDGFPAVLFVDASGAEVGRIGGYAPPGPYLKKLERVIKVRAAREKIKGSPEDVESLLVLGEDLLDADKREEAKANFDKVAALDPKDEKGCGAKAHFNLALILLFGKNDTAGAETEFKKVAELDPQDRRKLAEEMDFYRLQGFAVKKDMPGLAETAKAFLAKYPAGEHYDAVAMVLGKVHFQMGKPEEAIAQWEAYVKDHPTGSAVAEATALIEQVKKHLAGAAQPGPAGAGDKEGKAPEAQAPEGGGGAPQDK